MEEPEQQEVGGRGHGHHCSPPMGSVDVLKGQKEVSEWPQDKGDAQDTDGLAFNSSPAPGLIVLPDWNFISIFPQHPPPPHPE